MDFTLAFSLHRNFAVGFALLLLVSLFTLLSFEFLLFLLAFNSFQKKVILCRLHLISFIPALASSIHGEGGMQEITFWVYTFTPKAL